MGRNLAHWTESYLPERINTCSPCLIAEIKRRNPQGKGEGPECFVAEHIAAGYKEISACLLHNTLLRTKKCHCTDAGEHFYTFFCVVCIAFTAIPPPCICLDSGKCCENGEGWIIFLGEERLSCTHTRRDGRIQNKAELPLKGL